MKKIMFFTVFMATVSLCVAQALCQEHGYWPLDPGNDRRYENVSNPNDWVEAYPDGEAYGATIYRYDWHHDGVMTTKAHLFSVDVEGNVWLHGWYEPLAIPDAPHIIVDAPLWLGKTWENTAIWGSNTIHNVYTVIAEEDVSTSFGDFHCFKMQWDGFTDHLAYSETLWFHDGFGLIKYDVDDTEFNAFGLGTYHLAAAVVPLQATSWGAVKILYR